MRSVRIWLRIFAVIIVSVAAAWIFNSPKPSRQPPSALQGQLDLSGWRFESDGLVQLKGEWDWRWQQLFTAEQMRAEAAAGALDSIRLPSSWNNTDGENKRAYGYATFRLRVHWNEPPPLLGMRIQSVASSYRLWVDGVPFAGLGQVGTSRATTVSQESPQTYLFPARPEGTEIVIQVANFEHRSGGLWETIELGTPQQLQSKHERKQALDFVLFGSLLMMAAYHFALYMMRHKDCSTLYFGAFCLLVAIRTMLVGEVFFYELFPHFPWGYRLRLEYLTLFLGLPTFALFMLRLYPHEMSRLAVRLIVAFSGIFIFVALVSPPSISTRTIPWYHFIVLLAVVCLISVFVRAALRSRPGAPLASIGAIIYAISVVNDMLYFQEAIRTGSYSPLGLIVFVMLHSAVLSMKFSRALTSEELMTQQLAQQASQVQILNEKLRESNRDLEAGIAKRTQELEQSNDSLARKAAELVRMDSARRQLLSNISHELRTPMTSIRGYVEAILDNIFTTPQEQRHYMQLILNKMIGLNRLIADLFELSKLESGQPDLHFHSVPLAVFLEKTRMKHELDVVHHGLRFEWDESALQGLSSHASVILDPERIDQVVTNLVSNAVRYTPDRGDIRFRFSVELAQRDGGPVRELVVQVQDTGTGIAHEDLPFIFERFYRGREAASGGSGLGLAIAKEIVTHHGGSIWAQSREGVGSSFGFTLLLFDETNF